METVVSATEARIRFGDLMRRVVERRKPIIVERSGKPVVVVLSVDQYEQLLIRQRQGDWREKVQRAHRQVLEDLHGRSLPPTEHILTQLREERDEQLLAVR